MNSIQQALQSALPARRKTASKGWISFNAPCCIHNGETPDRRMRGGLLINPDGGFSYHCFNCQYKASWKPGYHLGYRARKLMSWLGLSDDQIQVLVFDAMRQLDQEIVVVERNNKTANFKPKPLPENSLPILDWIHADFGEDQTLKNNLEFAVEYLINRGFGLDDYNWYWSPESSNQINRRIILPFTWQNKIIGYTARSINPTNKLKYFNSFDSDYVFNTDAQSQERKFVIVVEGPFDAIAVGGVAVLTNEINETKAEIIESLGKEIIVVPDRDRSGGLLIDSALKYGWNVSFPLWQDDIKDCAAAMQRYGKLYTLRSILEGKQTSALKIELIRKQHGI